MKVAFSLKERNIVEVDKLRLKSEAYDTLNEEAIFLQLQYQLAIDYQDELQAKYQLQAEINLSIKTQFNEVDLALKAQTAKFNEVDLALKAQTAKFEARFEAQEAKFEARFEAEEAKFEEHKKEAATRMKTIAAAIAVAASLCQENAA